MVGDECMKVVGPSWFYDSVEGVAAYHDDNHHRRRETAGNNPSLCPVTLREHLGDAEDGEVA